MILRPSIALPIVITCYWSSYSGLRTILAPHLTLDGTSATALALILAVSAIPSFLLAIPAGGFAERIGFAKVVATGAALIMACSIVLVLTSNTPVLVLSQTAMGFGTLMVWLGLQGMMVSGGAASQSGGQRLIQLSLYMSVGQLLGPLIGGVLAGQANYEVALIGMLLITTVGLAGSFALQKLDQLEPPPAAQPAGESTSSFKVATHLFGSRRFTATIIISFASLLMLDVKSAFQPLYYQHIGYSPTITALILTVNGVAALASRAALPAMNRRFSPETLSLLVVPLSCAATGGVFLFENLPALIVLAAISGIGLGMAQTLTLQLLAFLTREGQKGIGIGVRMVANRAAQWTSPLVFGCAMAVSGLSTAFAISTSFALFLTVPTSLYLHNRRHLSVGLR